MTTVEPYPITAKSDGTWKAMQMLGSRNRWAGSSSTAVIKISFASRLLTSFSAVLFSCVSSVFLVHLRLAGNLAGYGWEGGKIEKTKSFQIQKYDDGSCQIDFLELIEEEPLLVRVDNRPYSVVMRTPGNEVAHAVGLCLGEGILGSPDDFRTLGYDENLDPNVVDVWLTPGRREKVVDILKRKIYTSQTSCGICGKQMARDLRKELRPAPNGFTLGGRQVLECVDQLFERQSIYPRTRGSHASVLFDKDLEVLAFAEDVGRHNALDKVLGRAFLDRTLSRAALVVMSSRLSYELIQKSARAGISMMVSKSRPTALAVEMARDLNMTLACAFGKSHLMILCGEERIIR